MVYVVIFIQHRLVSLLGAVHPVNTMHLRFQTTNCLLILDTRCRSGCQQVFLSVIDSFFYIIIHVHLQCNNDYSISEQIAPSLAIYCQCKTPCNDAGSLSGYRLLLCNEWYSTAHSDIVVSLFLIRLLCCFWRVDDCSQRCLYYVTCDMQSATSVLVCRIPLKRSSAFRFTP